VKPYFRRVRLGVVANQPETDITVNSFLRLQGMATGTTSFVPMAYAIRVKRVAIWFTSATVGTSISSTVEWNAGSTGFLMDGVSAAATTMSTTEPACLETKPPTESLASWYQAGPSGGTNVLFSISAPAGAIIEVDYDWVPNLTEATYTSVTVSGAVTGTMYACAWNTNILALPPLNSIF
jgi:hypothetical protein